MKKLLIAMLALLIALSVSLTACNKDKDPDPIDDPDDDELVARPSDDDENNDKPAPGGEDENDDPSTPTTGWEAKAGTVYALTNCNIRSSASTTSAKLGTAKLGDAFTRVETNGKWTKITYNDGEAFILNDLVTESAQRVNFIDKTAENKVLHVKSNGNEQEPIKTNLRNAPVSAEAAVSFVTTITAANTANGELKLVALSEDGKWARVSYTGTIGSQTFNGTETLYVHWEYIQELNPGNSGSDLPG